MGTASAAAGRARRRVVRAVLVLVGGLLLPELLLRFLLFSELPAVARATTGLRRADLYALPNSREHWWLTNRFHRGAGRPPVPDAELGFLSRLIEPGTYRHTEEDSVGTRRPVLLYGDSFAQCVTDPVECWEGLLEESELGATHRLLNYGVGGYGLDQAVLLLERSLPRYLAGDPLVVIGIMIDDDLDRCALPLRDFPKPWFEWQADGLVLRPPPAASAREFVQAVPCGIESYLLRAFLGTSGLLASEFTRARVLDPAERDELPQVARALLERAHAVCESAGVEHFFVLFHGRSAVKTRGPYTWREELACTAFAELGAPFVSSKRWLWQAARESGRTLDTFYNPPDTGRGRNHYPAETNRVVFAALRAGIARVYEPPQYLAGAEPPPGTR